MNEFHAKEMGRAARGATRMPDPDAMVGKAVNDRAGSHAAHLSAQNSAISAVATTTTIAECGRHRRQ